MSQINQEPSAINSPSETHATVNKENWLSRFRRRDNKPENKNGLTIQERDKEIRNLEINGEASAVLEQYKRGSMPIREATSRLAGPRIQLTDQVEELESALENALGAVLIDRERTGLPNETYLKKVTLENLFKKQKPFGVVVLDLDNFRSFNDISHDVGDEALVHFANTIRHAEQAQLSNNSSLDQLAALTTIKGMKVHRVGGDEFIITLPNAKSPQDVKIATEYLRTNLAATPFSTDKAPNLQKEVTMTAAGGICVAKNLKEFTRRKQELDGQFLMGQLKNNGKRNESYVDGVDSPAQAKAA